MVHRTAFVSSLPPSHRFPLDLSISSRHSVCLRPKLSPHRPVRFRRRAWYAASSSSSSSSAPTPRQEDSADGPPSASPATSTDDTESGNGVATPAVQNGVSDSQVNQNGSDSEVALSSSNGKAGNGTGNGTAVSVDLAKNIPPSLIDSSGALQIDDGSLSPEVAPLVPRRLVRRRGREKPTSLQAKIIRATRLSSVRTDLQEGFDSGAWSTVILLGLFGIWYWSNAAFNVLNKQALHAFPFPLTITCVQFAVASVIMASTWLLRVKEPPSPSLFVLRTCLPLGMLHAAGFVLTNMSLGKVSVAFTHTVKATEPFFSVALTPSILGDVPTWGIIGSLFPIVAGVAIASATDVSFNWIGFLSAVGSNLMLQSRNVLSKRLMDTSGGKARVTSMKTKKKGSIFRMRPMTLSQRKQLDSLDNMNLFATMTILAFLVLIPFGLIIEGFPLLASATSMSSSIQGMSQLKLMRLLVVGGIYRCLDVLASYMILKRVSPVSHSIGNCVKRAIVIGASVFFFKTKVTTLNIIGTMLALFGVFTYSIIVSACKQNFFGPDSPFCRPIYTEEVELTEGGGI